MKIWRFALLSLLVVVSLVALQPVRAQQVSNITGVVVDQQDAAVAGVKVKLENPQTGLSMETVTTDEGAFLFSKLPPGAGYTLSFSRDGFKSISFTSINLSVGTTETRNAKLEIGATTQTVEINAEAIAPLNTTDAAITNTIDQELIRNLPVLLRENPSTLMNLEAGVVGSSSGNTNQSGSVTGSRADQQNLTIDGIDANDHAGNFAFTTVGNAPIDSISQFSVTTAAQGVTDVHSSGGQIALVTKSGTNQYHGSLYEFNRTAATAANTFFNNRSKVGTPALTRNQFGASIGGPIKKEKLFYFFNYEARRQASGSSQVRTVPLDATRNGSLAYINNGLDANNKACSPINTGDGAARLNNPVTAQCISFLSSAQIAALDPSHIGVDTALLNFTNGLEPSANDVTGGDGINTGSFRFNAPVSLIRSTYVGRVDYNLTSKQRLFGRITETRANATQVVQQFPGQPTPELFFDKTYAYVIGHNWTIDGNNVNSLTVGVTHQNDQFNTVFTPSFPNSITFGPYAGGPLPGLSSQSRVVPVYTLRDDYSWTKGHHQMQFGVNIKPTHLNSTLTNSFNFTGLGLGGALGGLDATLRPPNINTTGTATANWDAQLAYTLGVYSNQSANINYSPNLQPLGPGSVKVRDFKFDEYAAYWQDSWRMRSDLTLTFGTNWVYYTPPYEVNGFEAIPNVGLDNLFQIRQANGAAGIGGNTAAPLFTYDLAGKANHAPSFFNPTSTNFGPRLGIAWNPGFHDGILGRLFGDRKTSIRAGGSIVYDSLSNVTFIADQASFLFDDSAGINFGSGTTPGQLIASSPRFVNATTSPGVVVPPVHTRPVTPNVLSDGTLVGEAEDQLNFLVDPNFKPAYEYTLNFGIQRELRAGVTLEINYVGRFAHRLFAQADAAQIVNFTDPTSGQTLEAALVPLTLAARAPNAVAALAAVPNQPFWENLMNVAVAENFGPGQSCVTVFHRSCTQLVAAEAPTSTRIGSLSNVVRTLNAAGVLDPNIGLLGQFSSAAYVTDNGNSSYNALLVSVHKRVSHGLQMDFNYAYSHALDNQSSVANTVTGGVVCDLRDARSCRASSDFDLRHNVVSDWLYSLPIGHKGMFFKDMPRWADAIVGGWQVSGIWTWHTGFPVSFGAGDTPISRSVPGNDLIIGPQSAFATNIHTDNNNAIQAFSSSTAALAALAAPLGGTTGSRNDYRIQNFWNVDAAVLKNFRMPWHEGHTLQFRAEAFNLLNHNDFGSPDTNVFDGTFGQITTSQTGYAPRQMQFGIRYDF
ncbi:MAG TPA: carboxypeptidase-like regulatory domain-containing protein [Candidatus Acidoferrum sp.]